MGIASRAEHAELHLCFFTRLFFLTDASAVKLVLTVRVGGTSPFWLKVARKALGWPPACPESAEQRPTAESTSAEPSQAVAAALRRGRRIHPAHLGRSGCVGRGCARGAEADGERLESETRGW